MTFVPRVCPRQDPGPHTPTPPAGAARRRHAGARPLGQRRSRSEINFLYKWTKITPHQRNVHNAYAMQRGAWAPPFNSRLGLNSMYSTVVVIVCGVQKQLTKRGAVHACGAAGCGELADRDDAVAAQEQLRGAPLLPLPAVVGR